MLVGTEDVAGEFRRAYRQERLQPGGRRELDGRLAWVAVRAQIGDTIAYCHVMQELTAPSDLCEAYRRIQVLLEARRERDSRERERSEAA